MDNNIDLLSSEEVREHLVLMKLHELRDYYRNGWVPDWKDDKYKYVIIHFNGSFIVSETVFSRKFLSFQSNEVAKEFLTNFSKLMEQAGDLI